MEQTDIEQIAMAVCGEFGIHCTLSTSRYPEDPYRWRLEVRRADRPNHVRVVSLYCGATTSSALIRDSLMRQLELE